MGDKWLQLGQSVAASNHDLRISPAIVMEHMMRNPQNSTNLGPQEQGDVRRDSWWAIAQCARTAVHCKMMLEIDLERNLKPKHGGKLMDLLGTLPNRKRFSLRWIVHVYTIRNDLSCCAQLPLAEIRSMTLKKRFTIFDCRWCFTYL